MSDETITNQEQADRINGCENNQSCVDSEIKKVSDELIITDDEANAIKVKKQPNQETNVTVEPTPKVNKKTRLSKMSSYFSNKDKDELRYSTNYVYNQNGKIKKEITRFYDDNSTDILTYEYTTNKTVVRFSEHDWGEYIYKDGIDIGYNGYDSNNNLVIYSNVLEHDSQNRPIKIKEIGDIKSDNPKELMDTYTYNGEYLISYERISNIEEDWYYQSIYSEYKYDKNHKCISMKGLTGSIATYFDFNFYSYFYSQYQCINWTSQTTITKVDNKEYISNQEIIYNDKGLPTRIDSYKHYSVFDVNLHYYYLFEYE